jgi:hypothetical protein
MDPKSKSQELFMQADQQVAKIVAKAVELERNRRRGESKTPKNELVKFIKEIVS